GTWDSRAFFTPGGSANGSALFDFTTPTTTTNTTVNVTDTFAGTLGTLTATNSAPFAAATYTYSRPITGTPGTCTSFDNTATIVQTIQPGPSASQTVKVCVGLNLTVSKTATPYLTRTYNWDIGKVADKTVVKQFGGTATFNYTIKASETGFTDSNWKVTGTITVSNPNDWEPITAIITDAVDNGGSCAVTDGTGV